MMSVCPAVACIAALLVACGGEHGDGEAATVTFQAGTFAPSRVEILAGQSVRFVNASESAVRPASHIHPTHAIYPEFDSGRSIPAGESWTFRFERPGYWRYHNHLDAPQTGLVVVRGGGSEGEFPPLRAAHEHVAFDPIGRLPEDVAHALLVDDALLHDFVQTYGPTQVVAVLAEAGARAGLDCHERAHMLGHHAYQDFGAVALAAAGHECHSGAYHGATEAMFRERGTLSLERDVAVVCDAMTNTFFRHQCVHGVGHGLMAWTSYELRDALELCDGVGRALDRESCYSGVFMENVVGGLQGAMGHRTEYLSRDPHFPCNILGPRYVAACYFYQTSHMLNIFRGDFSRVAAACGVLAGFPRRLCFKSMGRDVGGRTRHQPERSIGLCASARATQDRRQCLAGAVQDYFWDSAGADPAVRFCRTLTDEPEVRSCYDTIIGRARDILVEPGALETFCEMLEPPYRSQCRQTPSVT